MIDSELPIDKAIVLSLRHQRDSSKSDDYLAEATGLAVALGVNVVHSEVVPLREAHVANFFGGGRIQDIKDVINAHSVNIVIVNAGLSPIQQRNLERAWKVKVIDRTGLILEIFGLRAATKEGRLQVEMARLAYERSRLVRTWTHLERQRGGQGFLAGPGETQIEADRRVLNDKIAKLRKELDTVRRHRGLQRQKRKRAPEWIVALVGYTNAGKSTLFNQLTDGDVFAKDMLFATLDTTHRVFPLPTGKPAILSDTVGFIQDLPTDLISSFRATLEEVKEADILLHVRDMSDPLKTEHKENVLDVLDQIGAGPEHEQTIIEVWNKVDLLDDLDRAELENQAERSNDGMKWPNTVLVSAVTGQGLDDLRSGVESALMAYHQTIEIAVPPQSYDARAWLHRNASVLTERTSEDGVCLMEVQLSDADLGKLKARFDQLEVSR